MPGSCHESMSVNWICIKVHGLYMSSAVCLCRTCAKPKQWQWIYGEMEMRVQLGLCTPSLANTLAGPSLGLGQEPDVGRQQNSRDTATYFVCVRAPESRANPNGFGHSPYGLCCRGNHHHWGWGWASSVNATSNISISTQTNNPAFHESLPHSQHYSCQVKAHVSTWHMIGMLGP